MPIPNLIHPAPITLVQKDLAGSDMDVDAREPIQQVSRLAAVILSGQPRFKSLGVATQYHRGGVVATTDGYVLFRYIDLDNATPPIVLAQGDRITQIGRLTVDIYIERLEPTAPYPDQNGNTLVKAHCKDRSPSRGVA